MREIDPANPNLTYFSDPNSAPSQAALDRLNAAVEAAAIKRVADKAMTSGVPIGAARSSPDISLLPGGTEAAGELFDYLRVGTAPYESDSNKTILKLPRSAGYLTFRRLSRGGDPAIDVNVPGASALTRTDDSFNRRGRTWSGHPRAATQVLPVRVDTRHKAGQDDYAGTESSECI